MITTEMVSRHGMYLKKNKDGAALIFNGVSISTNLIATDLRYANLCGANLHLSNFYGADLRYSMFGGADLSKVDLRYADLRFADLRLTNLCGANLYGADLRHANLYGANIENAILDNANLYGANVRGLCKYENLRVTLSRLPDGNFFGYKKANTEIGEVIITLEIPADAKRSNSTGMICRASRAIVKNIEGIGFQYNGEIIYSRYDKNFTYEIDKVVEPTQPFDEDWTQEFSTGIHFFITRQEAENYLRNPEPCYNVNRKIKLNKTKHGRR